MNRLILTALMAAGVVGLSAAPAAARTYDCSKAGNANKAECKAGAKPAKAAAAKPTAAKSVKAAAKPAPAKATAAKTATVAMTKTVVKTERNYDCRLRGNKNKAACKTVAAPAAKPMAPVAKPMVATAKTAPRAAPMKAAAAPASADDKNPVGSIGRCKDGFYSHSKQRTGACSRHGGVAKWS